MKKRQRNQIKKIQRNLKDLSENYPDISVFVNMVSQEFNLEYLSLDKYTRQESYKIDEFIQRYEDKVDNLYGLI